MVRLGTSKLFSLAVLYLFVTAFSSAVCADNPLQITASYAIADGHPVIRYVFKNISSNPIAVDKSLLPWATLWSTKVVLAYKGPMSDVIPRAGAIDDIAPPMPVTLKPGEELTGDSPLEDYVSNFMTISKKQEIVLFWLYSAEASDYKTPLGNYGGWLILPRSK